MKDTMEHTTGGRWYDAHPELACLLERLKGLEHRKRLSVVRKVKKTITAMAPGLIDQTVMNYPFTYKRRWYDADPLLWLTINGLRCCEELVLQSAIACLREELKKKRAP